MPRVKVCRPHYHGPWIVHAVLVGAAIGVLLELSTPITTFYWSTVYSALPGWPATALIGPLFLLSVLHRDCRHLWWAFVTGGMATGTMAMTLVLLSFLSSGPNGPTPWEILGEACLWVAIAGAVGGLLNVGFCKLKEALFGARPIQDGTLCPTCAYTITNLPEARCPECGISFTPSDIDASPPDPRREWRRFSVRLAVLVVAVFGAYQSFPAVLLFYNARQRDIPFYIEYVGLNAGRWRSAALRMTADSRDLDRATGACALGFICHPNYGGVDLDSEVRSRLWDLALNDPSASVRMMAVQSLSLWDPEDDFFQMLPRLMQDSAPYVRWHAVAGASAGGDMPNARGTPYLIEALTDPDPNLRRNAFNRLVANTGHSFPFDPNGPLQLQLAQQAIWREWWRAQPTPGAGP